MELRLRGFYDTVRSITYILLGSHIYFFIEDVRRIYKINKIIHS
jgi:hypothetical protein